MNAYDGIAGPLDRIAAATSIIRTRVTEKQRHEENGGELAELKTRVKACAKDLEAVARKLERSLNGAK